MQTSSRVLVPQSVTVGLECLGPNMFAVWNMAENSVLLVENSALSVWYFEDSTNDESTMMMIIVAMQKLQEGEGVYVMVQDWAMGNQSIMQLPQKTIVKGGGRMWNSYIGFWGGELVLSSFNSIVGLAGLLNLTGILV